MGTCRNGACTVSSRSCAPNRCNGSRCGQRCSEDPQCATPNVCVRGSCGKKPNGEPCAREHRQRVRLGDLRPGGLLRRRLRRFLRLLRAAPVGGGLHARCRPGRPIRRGCAPTRGPPPARATACATGGAGAGCTPAGTVCAPASCGDGVAQRVSRCDGAGACVAGATEACNPIVVCDQPGVACEKTCTSDSQCVSGTKCFEGRCGLLENGKACTGNGDCKSGFCVDGVCCDRACGGNNQNDCLACSREAGGADDGTLRHAGHRRPLQRRQRLHPGRRLLGRDLRGRGGRLHRQEPVPRRRHLRPGHRPLHDAAQDERLGLRRRQQVHRPATAAATGCAGAPRWSARRAASARSRPATRPPACARPSPAPTAPPAATAASAPGPTAACAGECVGSDPVVCAAGACHEAGPVRRRHRHLQPTQQGRRHPVRGRQPLHAGGSLHGGACLAGAPKSCASANVCQTAGTCDPADGQCKGGTARPDETPCDDDNLLHHRPIAARGACAPGASVSLPGRQRLPGGRRPATR